MPKYDRELIARMLETPSVFEDASRREQARLLREADNLEADARTVAREVPDGMVAMLRECYEWLFDSKSDGPRVSEGAHLKGYYTPEFLDLHTRLSAMLSAASGDKGVG